MYSFNSRIRYSEVDKDQCLTLGGIINYFQDCSTFQSEDIGLGIEYLTSVNRVWVVSSWQVVVNRYPKLGEAITIGTWAYDFQGFIGYRNFVMKDEHDEMIACANSVWAYLDTETGKFARAGDREIQGYVQEPKLDMEYADRKIRLSGEGIELKKIKVQEHHLDTNMHVNNEQYIKLALRLLPKHREIKHMRAEYKKSAVLGDSMYPILYTEEQNKKFTIALCDEAKKPYTIVEFITQ